MERRGVVQPGGAVEGSVAVLPVPASRVSEAGLGTGKWADEGAGGAGSPAADDGVDLLRVEYGQLLDTLAQIKRDEAALAARKVRAVARCATVGRALAGPATSPEHNAG